AGEEVTPAADVYALGASLYEALTGRTPHEFRSLVDLVAKQQEVPIAPVRELAPDVPAEIEDIVMRCLARRPEFRPSAAEVAAELGAPQETLTVPLSRQR